MVFYDKQEKQLQLFYDTYLIMMASLSKLFSSSETPYLDSRISENLFCRCLDAQNLSRSDTSADAKKGNLGIGIKTFIENSHTQKIAEFNKLRPTYSRLDGIELVKKISEYRNERIEFACSTHNIKTLIYHCIVREKGFLRIKESTMDKVLINDIHITGTRNNTISFTDGLNNYSFNTSKSVMMKNFEKMTVLKELPVSVFEDPYLLLEAAFFQSKKFIPPFSFTLGLPAELKPKTTTIDSELERIYLPLYSKKNNKKYVPEKSGLNQWNASGRSRHPNEVYIPIPAELRHYKPEFFPPRDTAFTLILPNEEEMSAKVCQDGSKALMSNPNKALGHWLLRDVLGLEENELLTYKKFEILGVDSVVIEKIEDEDLVYRINFAFIDSYEDFINKFEE